MKFLILKKTVIPTVPLFFRSLARRNFANFAEVAYATKTESEAEIRKFSGGEKSSLRLANY